MLLLLLTTPVFDLLQLMLNSAAMCLCVAVSCLSKKFAVWSLPGAFQFSVVLSVSATSFSHTGFHSMLGFCCYWFFIQHASSLCLTLFPYISLQKFSTSSLSGVFFTMPSVCLSRLKNFLVFSKELILVILIFSFPVSR